VGLSKEGLATPISGPGPGPIIVIVIVVIVVVIIAVAAAVAPALGFRTSGARLHKQDNAADHRE
jgi:flagellar basal body-associated protein FliL